jgi:hypothetical protein
VIIPTQQPEDLPKSRNPLRVTSLFLNFTMTSFIFNLSFLVIFLSGHVFLLVNGTIMKKEYVQVITGSTLASSSMINLCDRTMKHGV